MNVADLPKTKTTVSLKPWAWAEIHQSRLLHQKSDSVLTLANLNPGVIKIHLKADKLIMRRSTKRDRAGYIDRHEIREEM